MYCTVSVCLSDPPSYVADNTSISHWKGDGMDLRDQGASVSRGKWALSGINGTYLVNCFDTFGLFEIDFLEINDSAISITYFQ